MESLTRAQQELYDWLVKYIEETQHAPSIRQMMRAMNLRSPAPIQSRLERLRNKGYIDWTDGKARTLRILHHKAKGLPVLGELTNGEIVEPTTEDVEKLDLGHLLKLNHVYALKVCGDSLEDDLVADGDMLILRSVTGEETIADGELVAVRVDEEGTTLKRYYQEGDNVLLKAMTSHKRVLELKAHQVEIQGILIGVWRNYQAEE
jgi:repressor LexA